MSDLRDWLREHWKAGNGTMPDDLAKLAANLAERLGRIRLRVEPASSWTIDDAIKQVGWIDDECRIARRETEEFMDKYSND